ncbi:MAG: Rib/alpha-like domain-containing protein [Collinsella sp.]|nr:Rib/alpha-like domain-containing protein [Collinsella sp.]
MSSKSTGAAAFRRRASVTAALSLGLVLGGAAVVPATVWAAEAASDVTWSTQRQILTISVRYVGANGSMTSNELASKLSLSVKNAETGEVTALSAMDAPFSFQFQANQLKAGTYTLSVTGVPEDVVLMTTRPSGFSQVLTQVKNGETFTVNETGDPNLGMNYGATTLYLLATAAQSTQYDPKAQDITVDFNGKPAAEDSVANKDELPAGTTFAWEKAPDTSVSGDTTGTVKVTYPDGSSETVEVPVHVKLRRQMITVAVSVRDESTAVAREAAAGMALSIKGADGAVHELVASSGNYSFQFQARQLEAGDYTLSVADVPEGYRLVAEGERSGLSTGLTQAFDGGNVALRDTSVNAANTVYLVLARTQSSVYTPEPKPIETEVGGDPDPEDGIGNLPDLPDGTKVEWEQKPDTSKPGDTAGTIKVTYPDGTSETVEVTVSVKEPEQDGEKTDNSGADDKGTAQNGGKTPSRTGAGKSGAKKSKKARALPQTGDAAVIATLGVASAGAVAGFAGALGRRRKK